MEGVKMENRQYQEDKKEEREEQILLQVHNVTKQYVQKGGGRTGIEGISFTIQRGEFYGIVGESGAGKSTLGKIIAGIEPQDSGNKTVVLFSFWVRKYKWYFRIHFQR